MSFTSENARQPRVMREIRDAKGNLIQIQEEAHDAATKGKTSKHAEETIVTDNKGSYDTAGEHETTIGSILEEDAATSRESEISKIY